MNISLCYIEGISRIDTPYFSTGREQEDYFDTKIVKTIETTFYPPHYNNSIYVSDVDCDINTQVNYLFFEYKDKRYYYFIDSIEYSSESVIILHITMDYIQTYMFNIYIEHGVIQRKFINRFVDDTTNFNREYIRENPSSQYFVEQKKDILVTPSYWVVVKCSSDAGGNSYTTKFNYMLAGSSVSYRHINSPYMYFFFPLRLPNSVVVHEEGGATNTYPCRDAIGRIMKELSPYIADSYVVPISPYPSLVYVDTSNKLHIYKNRFMPYQFPLAPDGYTSIVALNYQRVENFTNQYSADCPLYGYFNAFYIPDNLNFTKNTLAYTTFNTRYLPVLLDENFVKIEFGNDSVVATYPLFYMSRATGYSLVGYNPVIDGMWSFGIVETDDIEQNPYITFVTDTNKACYDIIVDTETAYVSNNQNRWITAGISSGVKLASDVISVATYATKINALGGAISAIPSDINNLDKRTKKYARLKSSKLREMNDLSTKRDLTVLSMAESLPFVGGAIPLVNQGIIDNNMKRAPDTVKQVSSYVPVYNTFAGNVWARISKVIDYEQCGRYFQRNGYLVNKYINQVPNIFSYVRNRYHFNIVKMSDMNLHLKNVIEDVETLSNISERLTEGVRLWNRYRSPVWWNYGERTIEEFRTVTINLFSPTGTGAYSVENIIKVEYRTTEGQIIESVDIDVTQQDDTHIICSIYNDNDATIQGKVYVKVMGSNENSRIGNFNYDNVELDYYAN